MTYSLTADATVHWVAVVLYVLASVLVAWGVIIGGRRVERIGYGVVGAGIVAHSGTLLYRWIGTGHGPYISRYEVLSANALVLVVTFLVLAAFFSAIRPASIIVFPATFLMIALGMFFDPSVRKLPPSLRSIWLVLHVSFYKISVATALIALALSVLYFLKGRSKARWIERLPDRETMDAYAYRFAGFAFTFWAIGMLAGSIWAYYSWGSFWNWDPIETWSLATWIAFGVYLHLRRFFGWKGERAAYLYLVVFGMALVTAFFVSVLEVSLHGTYFT